jgi:predicted RNase H-like HicB family nuclease
MITVEHMVRFDIQIPVKVFKEGAVYVAHCPVFDVASQGETREGAKQNLVEALTLFLTTCYDMGTLESVLKECGFKSITTAEMESLPSEEEVIEVPLPFIIHKTHQSECRA